MTELYSLYSEFQPFSSLNHWNTDIWRVNKNVTGGEQTVKRKTNYRGPFHSCNNGMPSQWTNSYRILICKAWKNTRYLLIVISLLDGVLSYKWIRFCFNPQVSSFYWLLLIYITKQCLNQIFSEIFFSDPKVCKDGISLWYIICNLLILCCIIFIII